MNELPLHNSFSENSEPPVPIPAAEAAWENMQQKLDESLPVLETQSVAIGKKSKKRTALFLLLIGFMSVLLITDRQKFSSNKQISVATEKKQETRLQKANLNATTTVKLNTHKIDSQQNELLNALDNHSMLQDNAISRNKQEQLTSKYNAGVYAFHQSVRRERISRTKKKTSATIASTDAARVNNANLFQTPIAVKQPADSNHSKQKPDIIAHKPEVADASLLRAGLQWDVPLPLAGAANYFAGAPALPQSYVVLLPGVWLSLTEGTSSFSVEVHPLAAALLKDKPFSTTLNTIDSALVTTKKTLIKTFGLAAGLQYHYNVKGMWWLGGVAQGNWWKKGLVLTNSITEKRDAANNVTITQTNENRTYSINATNTPDISKFQLFTLADLLYKTRKWEAGFRTGVSFMPLSLNVDGPKNQLQAALFFRLCLLHKETKRK